jgi:hypothetical protein
MELFGTSKRIDLELSPEARRASPSYVLTVSRNIKAGVVLGVPISFYAALGLLIYPPRLQPLWMAFALLSAIFCSLAVFVFCWASVVAYFVRKFNLSPNWCNWAGWPFILAAIPVAIAGWFGTGRNMSLGVALFWVGAYAARVCRSMAYPALSQK